VAESLVDMRDIFGGERNAVLARELTKMFETVIGEPLTDLAAMVLADPDQQRGEHVIIVAGRGEEADAKLAEGRRVFALLRDELPPAKAAKLAAVISGAPRKLLYEAGGAE
jgi:16S rRNA (cytidine1402-2'-O)-methyltransferase